MKLKFLFAFVLVGGFALQGQTYLRMAYPISWAAGNTADRIDNTSWVGYHFELGQDIHSNFAVGVESGWVTLYDEAINVTETFGTTTVNGTQFRYLNVIPIQAKFTYRIENSSAVVPFVAGAAGVSWVDQTTDLGIYRISNEVWPFTTGGELGVSYEMDYSTKFQVSGYYNFIAKTDNLISQAYWGIRVGFQWTM